MSMQVSRWLILLSYSVLLLIGAIGLTWLAPPKDIPRALPVIVYCLPLLLPLRGVIHGNGRSTVIAGLLALGYFALGVDTAFNRLDTQRILGWAMIVSSVTLFVSINVWLWARKYARQAQD